MHAEGKKATPASKADDNETKGCYNSILSGKAITCTQIEIRHLFKKKHHHFLSSSSLFITVFHMVSVLQVEDVVKGQVRS
jgi:hypothetical protein